MRHYAGYKLAATAVGLILLGGCSNQYEAATDQEPIIQQNTTSSQQSSTAIYHACATATAQQGQFYIDFVKGQSVQGVKEGFTNIDALQSGNTITAESAVTVPHDRYIPVQINQGSDGAIEIFARLTAVGVTQEIASNCLNLNKQSPITQSPLLQAIATLAASHDRA